MRSWLIVYARRQGELLRCQEFSDNRDALRERFAVEREQRDDKNLEVVVLSADSLEAIKATHSRYFGRI